MISLQSSPFPLLYSISVDRMASMGAQHAENQRMPLPTPKDQQAARPGKPRPPSTPPPWAVKTEAGVANVKMEVKSEDCCAVE